MKIVAKPIDTIVVFSKGNKPPRPWKFKLEEGGEDLTVKVDRIIDIREETIAGRPSIIYECQSFFGDSEKRYELKFIIKDIRWELYKI